MFKLSAIVFLVFSVYYTQCVPTQTSVSKTKSESDEHLHLYVNNGTEGVNYHLSPIVDEMKEEDKIVNAQVNAILPYLNFLFDGDTGDNGLESCLDQLEIQLINESKKDLTCYEIQD